MRTSLLVFTFLVYGCASSGPPLYPAVGPSEFQSWCRRALTNPTARAEDKQFRDAYYGAPGAVRVYFTQAYQLEMTPEMHSHTEEELQWILETLAYRLGDARFADILGQERPQVQSAVTHFLQPNRLKGSFPRTQALLDRAPKIDFPMEQAYRRDTAQ